MIRQSVSGLAKRSCARNNLERDIDRIGSRKIVEAKKIPARRWPRGFRLCRQSSSYFKTSAVNG
jgi:hypothetical protein